MITHGMSGSHLVVLFCSTAGQNGENLGSDEEQIVSFVYLLYDLTNNKVVALQQHYVRPAAEDLTETVLTEECRIQTGMSDEAIKNAQPLEQVLEEFERFIISKEVHPDHGGKSFCFVTDGQLHLRMCMLPETCKKNISLPNHYNKFFDLRKEFKRFYKVEVVNCIKDMLDFLGQEPDQSVEYGVKQCQEMASIIHRLINDGHSFNTSECIKEKLDPGICSKDDVVDDESVIRARGLPWQSSDQDIARFFRGLNVAKGGVALCLSQQGRRNGEALIRFESKEHRDLALRKHKHHLGQRYIEVYRASGKDFVNIAGGKSTEAQAFLSRHGDNGYQIIVRMRGLPYSCTPEQVLEFFQNGEVPVEVLDGEEGILFVHQADGRATGDAFVLFPNEEEACKALTKHRQCIGTRYIELFKSTTAEVQQVLNRSMDPRTPSENTPEPQLPPLIQQFPGVGPLQAMPTLPSMPSMAGLSALPPGLPTAPTAVPPTILMPQQCITSGTQRDCIRMRGLPFEASVTDILTFLGEHARNIVFQGVHMVYNAQGTPSGEAFIQMDSEQSSEIAALTKHKKFMFIGNKKRYIEVIQCSGEDMNLVLTNGMAAAAAGMVQPPTLPSNGMIIPQSTPPVLQRPLISPGGTMLQAAAGAGPTILPPHMSSGLTATAPAFTPGLYGHYGVPTAAPAQAAISHAQMMVPTPVPTMANTALAPAPMTHLPQRQSPYGAYHQPILYWYPSPPVSPQSSYYVQSCPSSVIMKGLPFNAQMQDVLAFLEGVFEMSPDVQIQRTPDGRSTGEAVITFGSRVEAERAVTERNRKLLGNRFVEIHMA